MQTAQSRCSFNCFLKADWLFIVWIDDGRLFQARGPATRKARSPALVFVAGTDTSAVLDDRRRPTRVVCQRSDAVHEVGWCAVVQKFCASWCIMVQSLNLMRSLIPSHWSWSRIGVEIWSNLIELRRIILWTKAYYFMNCHHYLPPCIICHPAFRHL